MWFIVALLLVVIVVLTYFLITLPAPALNSQATSTTTGTETIATSTNTVVVIDAPKSGALVSKTFSVTGSAPGTWYFEASFPIEVRDPSGLMAGTGHATALSDWMTTAQVPFKADITVTGYSGPAVLVLKKDNPSGLPQNDGSMTLPIVIQ